MSVYTDIRTKIAELEASVQELKAKYSIMTDLTAEAADLVLVDIDSSADDALSLLE